MTLFKQIVQRIMFVIVLSVIVVDCRGTDVIPTAATVLPPTPFPIYTTESSATPQQPTATIQADLSLTSQPTGQPTGQPSAIPNLADTLILYAAVQDDNWALHTYPAHPAFTAEVFDHFYSAEARMEDARGYTGFNFGPQLSPNGRYLLLPGVGGYGGFEFGGDNTGFWLANLQTAEMRQLLPQAKAATWSPYGDYITYVDGDTLYMLSAAAGAEPEPLFTHPNLWGLYARWSPDGRNIATITTELGEPDETGYPEIKDTYWLVNAAGKQVTELAERPGSAIEHVAEEMTWSPTGRYLLVRNQVFDLNGQQLSPDLMGWAHWLPVRKQLEAGEQELLLVNGRSGLRIMTIEGEELAHITDDFVNTWAFSHDGRYLAYRDPLTTTYLFVFDLQSYQSQRHAATAIDVQSLYWSGNNDFLLLDDGYPNSPIWALSLQPDSRPQVVIEKGALIDALPAPKTDAGRGTAVSIPTITPADATTPLETSATQKLVVFFARDDDIWHTGVNGDKVAQLTEGGALGWGMTQPGDDWRINALSVPPQFSPKGRWPAFSPDGRTISLLDTTAPGQLRRLTPGAAIPSWSPDSRYLAYATEGSLLIYDVENDVRHPVLNNISQISNVSWSPDMRYLAFDCCFVRPAGYSTDDFGEIRRVQIATGQVDIVDTTTLTIGGGTSPLCWTDNQQVIKQRDAAQNEVLRCSNYRSIVGRSPDGTLVASFSPSSPEDVYWEGDSLLSIRQTETNDIVWQRQMSGPATTAHWSPDGATIIFQRGSAAEGNLSIWRIPADGTAEPEPIVDAGYLLDVIPQWQQ